VKKRLLILQLVKLSNYCLPGLLLIAFFCSLFVYYPEYKDWFIILDNLFGSGVVLLSIVFIDGMYQKKCKWFFASVIGLMSGCIFNIIFRNNLHEEYVQVYRIGLLFISNIVVLSLMVYESRYKIKSILESIYIKIFHIFTLNN